MYYEAFSLYRSGGDDELSAARDGVVWVRGMLPTTDVRQILSAATVFVCPSVYEPLGIVAMLRSIHDQIGGQFRGRA